MSNFSPREKSIAKNHLKKLTGVIMMVERAGPSLVQHGSRHPKTIIAIYDALLAAKQIMEWHYKNVGLVDNEKYNRVREANIADLRASLRNYNTLDMMDVFRPADFRKIDSEIEAELRGLFTETDEPDDESDEDAELLLEDESL